MIKFMSIDVFNPMIKKEVMVQRGCFYSEATVLNSGSSVLLLRVYAVYVTCDFARLLSWPV